MAWSTQKVFTCGICGTEQVFRENENIPNFPILKLGESGSDEEIKLVHCEKCARSVMDLLKTRGWSPSPVAARPSD